MPRRVYMNSIPGRQRIHVEILAAEIPEVLEDLYESSLGRNRETEQLRPILEEAQERFAAAPEAEPDAPTCGVINPRQAATCTNPEHHDGDHRDAFGHTWPRRDGDRPLFRKDTRRA